MDRAKEVEKAELVEDLENVNQRPELESEFVGTRDDQGELAHFFAESLDLLCIAGYDGYFKRLNPAWTTRLGWSLEELQARPFLEFVHPGDRELTLAEIERRNKDAEPFLFENRYRHRDGSYRWLRWHVRPLPSRERIYAIARDVTRQMRLEREVLETLDQERDRLGRELHDGLCQTLAGIAAVSTTLSRKLAKNSAGGEPAAAAEITQLLSDAIAEARQLARGLGPLGVGEVGLEGALAALALNVEKQFQTSCNFACERPLSGLGREVGLHLFRISQEAVNNALTHGKGERIEISLASEGRKGLLAVQDNGTGIACDSPVPDGIGMHTMEYRARLIGGSLEVRRGSPRGTVVACNFPLPEKTDSSENPEHE